MTPKCKNQNGVFAKKKKKKAETQNVNPNTHNVLFIYLFIYFWVFLVNLKIWGWIKPIIFFPQNTSGPVLLSPCNISVIYQFTTKSKKKKKKPFTYDKTIYIIKNYDDRLKIYYIYIM